MNLMNLVVFSVLGGILASCGGDKSSTEYPNFSSVYESTISGCGASTCHSSTATGDEVKNGPDFSTIEKAYTALVGKKVSSFTEWAAASGNCKDATLVVASNPNTSIALAAVDETYSNNFGSASGLIDCVPSYSIHSANSALPAGGTSDLVTWITNGAQK